MNMPQFTVTGNKSVFFVSTALIGFFVLLGISIPAELANFFNELQGNITESFGWFYILSMSSFLAICIFLLFSKYGDIRLGPDGSRPKFSMISWFAMLFSAGMGIGLMFYGVAEPMMHYTSPAQSLVRGETMNAARNAMGITIFHWGLHPWACYSLVGLTIAYFSFRHNRPLSIRSSLYPLFGRHTDGWIGHLVDILAIVSTLFGVATSLGLGVMQVNSGLEYLFDISFSTTTQIVLICLITAAATASVVSGLEKGVKMLSELNMFVAATILLFVFLAGPVLLILNAIPENIGIYLQTLPKNSFWTAAFEETRREWLGGWTVFYWAWWIAWSPFVGTFIAKISRGRTIREFILAVLLAPTFMSVIWFTVMGNTAIHLEMTSTANIADAVAENLSQSLFVFLDSLPWSGITSMLGIACVITFFVTSSDSASLVIDTIASGGSHNPPVWQRIFWAVLEGLVAIALLLAGGLKGLQTGAITTALPFTVIIFIMLLGLFKSLREETERAELRALDDGKQTAESPDRV